MASKPELKITGYRVRVRVGGSVRVRVRVGVKGYWLGVEM
jgi:hypothetical protein